MAMMSPANAAARWKQGLQAAGKKMTDGVNGVTRAPSEAAIARADAMVAGVMESVASGKWQDGLRSVSLQAWKDSMINKGVPRLQSGAAAGESKMLNFMAQFLPFEESVVASLPPRGGLEENIARSAAVQRANAGFRHQKRS